MIRFPLLFLVFFALPSLAGQLYKWVDENGRTQYSQFPPEDGQSETMNIRNTPSNSSSQASKDKLNAMRQQLLEQSVDRNTQSEDEKEDARRAEIMAENCKNAQQNLRNIQNSGRMYRIKEDGEYDWYDEKQIAAKKQKAQEAVNKYCKG